MEKGKVYCPKCKQVVVVIIQKDKYYNHVIIKEICSKCRSVLDKYEEIEDDSI